jgi:hypothetical protein
MAQESKILYTSDGTPIQYMEKNANNFLDKTTFIFGGSASGKTTLIEEILYLIKDSVTNYLVIAPETSSATYRRKLPGICIKEDLSKKLLLKIWKRQIDMTRCCNMAKDPKNLEKLFLRINDRKTSLLIHGVRLAANSRIDYVKARKDIDFAQKRTLEAIIESRCVEIIRNLYVRAVLDNREYLEKQDLSIDEATALEYLETNPRICIVIDDCSEKIAKWMSYFRKGDENVFEAIVYKGRHNNITLLFVSHDDKLIKPELRRGARVTIFTTSQALIASLNKTQSGYTNQEKKEGMKIATRLFGSDDYTKTFQKLCYIREDPKPFKYTIANIYQDFELGGIHLRELAAKMPKTEISLEENQFVKELMEKKAKRAKMKYD